MTAVKTRRRQERRQTLVKVDKERRSTSRRAMPERRTSGRMALDMWMEEVRGEEVYFRRSCNISLGGVYFEQAIPYPVNTLLTLRFTLPGETCEIIAQGKVVSIPEDPRELGMGIQFHTFKSDGALILEKYLKNFEIS